MVKEMPKEVKAAISGLKFRTNQVIEDRETKKKTYVPHERPMTEDDVLSYKVTDEGVVIVSKDGMKHRVEPGKKAA